MDMITELVGYVEADRSAAHHAHWLAATRAEHEALNTFYHDVIEAVDAVVENYISMFGEFDFKPCDEKPAKDIKRVLADRADWIEANRDMIAQGSASLGALIDSLVTVYTHAGYMLRFA